jgi:DNA-binding NtrC family response regulator
VVERTTLEGGFVREKLDQLVAEMIERRIYLEEAVGEFEKKFILLALKKTEGNQSTAAKLLGLHRNTLSRKITLHKINGRH